MFSFCALVDLKDNCVPESVSILVGSRPEVLEDGVVVLGREDDLFVVQLADVILQLVVQVFVRKVRLFREIA